MDSLSLVEKANIYAKAITEPNRMKMLKIIGSAPPETISVGDIARILNISQPAVSKHLQTLNWCGFLRRRKVGNTVYYSLNKDAIYDFQKVATDAFERVWTPCEYDYLCDDCPYKTTCK